jgi:hypothetical protein
MRKFTISYLDSTIRYTQACFGESRPRPWQPKDLLIVSGFSGAGKSTFIAQLRKGTLSEEICGRLPPGAKNWIEISATQARALAQAPADCSGTDASPGSGDILHYPIDQFQRTGIRPYRLDPVLAVLPSVERAVVVVLCISPRRLAAQFSGRIAGKARKRGRLGDLLHRFVRTPIRAFRSRVRRTDILPPDPSLYDDADWFKTCFNSWDQFLQTALSGKPNNAIVYVEPTLTSGGEPSFLLLNKQQPNE